MTGNDIFSLLDGLIARAVGCVGLPEKLGRVHVCERRDLGEFQCNAAMAGASFLKRAPMAIGEDIIKALEKNAAAVDVCEKITLAKPGFINITLTPKAILRLLREMEQDPYTGGYHTPNPERVILDYGGPNIAKPLHVGHLRSALIGQALYRLFCFVGDSVTSDIHLGDWGLQMGQIIHGILEMASHSALICEEAILLWAREKLNIGDLEKIYPQTAQKCREDPAYARKAQKITRDLQAGSSFYHALWTIIRSLSCAHIKKDYAALGVTFDLWCGESDAYAHIGSVEKILDGKKLLQESEGARIVAFADDSMPPLLFQKSDGAALYATTDLATIYERFERLSPQRIIYVVDKRQSLHFKQVFETAHLGGMCCSEQLEHVAFGTMNGKDGKPFKTREGGSVRLKDLLALVEKTALTVLEENSKQSTSHFSAQEKRRVARQVGHAALKFGDLVNPREHDYIFDLERFLAFEGKTGPYLLYALIRIKSILAKCAAVHRPKATSVPVVTQEEDPEKLSSAEKDLSLTLLAFHRAVFMAYSKRRPHFLCEHAYRLAVEFSRFYTRHRIMDAPESVREKRLFLSKLCYRQIKQITDILCMEVPERM